MDFTRTHYYVRMTKYYGLYCVLLLPCIIVPSLCTYIVVTVTIHMYCCDCHYAHVLLWLLLCTCITVTLLCIYIVVTVIIHMYCCDRHYAHVCCDRYYAHVCCDHYYAHVLLWLLLCTCMLCRYYTHVLL